MKVKLYCSLSRGPQTCHPSLFATVGLLCISNRAKIFSVLFKWNSNFNHVLAVLLLHQPLLFPHLARISEMPC